MKRSGSVGAYAVLRATLGVGFALRGLRHLTSGLGEEGMRLPSQIASVLDRATTGIAVVELAVGGLVVLGLATRPALAGAAALTAGAVAMHAHRGDPAGMTMHLAFAGLAYVLAARRAENAWALDALFGSEPTSEADEAVSNVTSKASGDAPSKAADVAKDAPSGPIFVDATVESLSLILGPFGKILVREELTRMGLTPEVMQRSDCEKLLVSIALEVEETKRAKFLGDTRARIPDPWIPGIAPPAVLPPATPPPSFDPKPAVLPPPVLRETEPTGPQIVRGLTSIAAKAVGDGQTLVHDELTKMGLSPETMEWMHYELLVDSIASEIGDDVGREQFVDAAKALTASIFPRKT